MIFSLSKTSINTWWWFTPYVCAAHESLSSYSVYGILAIWKCLCLWTKPETALQMRHRRQRHRTNQTHHDHTRPITERGPYPASKSMRSPPENGWSAHIPWMIDTQCMACVPSKVFAIEHLCADEEIAVKHTSIWLFGRTRFGCLLATSVFFKLNFFNGLCVPHHPKKAPKGT